MLLLKQWEDLFQNIIIETMRRLVPWYDYNIFSEVSSFKMLLLDQWEDLFHDMKDLVP